MIDKNIKLIVADIDSTLVEKYQNISEYERQIIIKVREKGILFGLASGRPLYHCKDLCKKWRLPVDVLICNNGCNIYVKATDKEYDYDFLEPEWCKEIIDLMEPFDANIMMYFDNSNYCSKEDVMVKKAGNAYNYKYVIVDDLSIFYRKIEKLMFRIDEDKMDLVESKIKEHRSKNYKGFRTQPTMLEYCAINVSKGNALKKLEKILGVSCENMCAIGDTENDDDMIKIAGLSVCMLNGSDSTKKVADQITEYDCTHDGVGHFIEDYIL